MEVKMKDITPIDKSSLLNDACNIIEQAQATAYRQVNETLIKRNWLLGMRIRHEVLKDERAEYGEQEVKMLAKVLTAKYGEGFTWRNLYNYIDFYATYNGFFLNENGDSVNGQTILHALSAKSENIFHALRAKSPIEREAANEVWSTRTLQRNISNQYYHRMLMSQHKELVHKEMIERTSPLQDKMEFIKNPVIAEFLGFPQEATFTESEHETSIINNLQKFIMELGKGYAFVARQQHVHTEKEDYYIDLVFYNYLLKSFVLIDLKTTKVTHQDVGQMDMYVRMYDELKRGENDNPTIGILICADTDEDIARYSVLHDSDQLFAAKYKTYMPTDEELRAEIETQKNIYYLQHKEK